MRKRIEAFIFILLFCIVFGPLVYQMGLKNFTTTVMGTAHDLLINTVLYIMAITVIAGALSALFVEFGVVSLLQKILSPLMRPIFNLPGVASLGGIMTFFSDNPAIISLASDKNFYKYFKKYQFVSLTNFGTAFGMGLIVLTFMLGKGFYAGAFVGLIAAIVGAVVSTRCMQMFTKKELDEYIVNETEKSSYELESEERYQSAVFMRFLNAILDGGKKGVDLGVAIIPGILIISTCVMMVTFGPKDPSIGYQGVPYEGVPLLPMVGSYLSLPVKYLFGFNAPELIAFPVTSLGSVGAALSLVTSFIEKGIIGHNEIAVFTAMGMCWSGFLSTHSAMLDALKYRYLTGKAILSHTIGGICGGIFAHYVCVMLKYFQFIN